MTRSVLADGTWFKVPITQEGVYRMDRAFITSVLGLTPGSVDPNSIRVFGNGGAMLPALNSAPRPEDLVENPSFVQGGGDGRFDEGDYVLFFAKGPRGWTWGDSPFQQGTKAWQHYLHLFSNTNYYFIRVGGSGPRVGAGSFLDATAPTVLSTFEARHFVEVDREKAALYDLSTAQVGSAIRAAIQGVEAGAAARLPAIESRCRRRPYFVRKAGPGAGKASD